MSFETVHPALQAALARRGYATATPVQAAVLAPEVAGRDLLVSAQTGSGKTVAFGLAIAGPLLGEAERLGKPGAPMALVVAPTRELAQQVQRELAWLYADAGARVAACVGGLDPRREQHALAQGVHIVVGTPGRLCDHLERGALSLARVKAVVLDEADEMLDMGFREDLERLLDATPKERRTLLFSATIPADIASMAKRYQQKALRIATQGESDRHRDIEYRAIPIMPRERDLAVVNVLRYHDAPGALVFCATRDGVSRLAANLETRGFAVAALSGELSQRERNVALAALRDGRARVCVATDVAARGLDLPDLGLVIHADLPQNAQVLVHRSGRTGRAGRRGIAIVLVPDPARRYAERMLRTANVEAAWMRGPAVDEILERDRARLVEEIGTLPEDLGEDDRAIARTLLERMPAEELVAALVRVRREARPVPEELTVPPSMRPRPAPEPRHAPRPLQRQVEPRGHASGESRSSGKARGPGESSGGKARSAGESRNGGRVHGAVERRDDGEIRNDSEIRNDGEARNGGEPRNGGEARNGGEPRSGDEIRNGDGDATWFTINIGRTKNGDPKWLIPLLCRRGNITKREIGRIQVLARETRVEIAAAVAPSFAEAVRRPDPKDRNIHIEPLDGAP